LKVDDFMKVRWPVDKKHRDALSETIVYCFRDLLSCKEREDFLLRQNDERLTTTIRVVHRHAEICLDMLKMLFHWESYYPDEVRAAVEDFAHNCEFATLELRGHLPEYTPEAHDEGLSPATEGTIRIVHEHIVACMLSCDAFAQVGFDITL
jgi:hypothetical protein